MQSKRKRILSMLENGKISMDEALSLLENLEPDKGSLKEYDGHIENDETQNLNQEDWTESFEDMDQSRERKKYSRRKNNSSMDEIFDDLRHEFSHVGERFMDIMQTTVRKVKDFDFDAPFGHPLVFSQTMTKAIADIDDIRIDIDNGKVAISSTDEEEIRAVFVVKSHQADSEEEAKKAFNEKIVFVADNNKLRISSGMKLTSIELELYLPKKMYAKLSGRLINGSFSMKDIDFENIRVKTANGKIDVSKVNFEDAEFETANGPIELNDISGNKLEADTLNGRVYIDGKIKDVEAQSLSGAVVVTTSDTEAEKVEAKTVSGSVELYLPPNVPLSGKITSNIGKLNLKLNDVDRTSEQDQFLQKTIHFTKKVENEKSLLVITGETKTGSVFVCYNAVKA